MQLVFAVLIAFLLIFGTLEYQRTDFFSSENISKTYTKRIADNLFAYASTVKSYANNNPTITNSVVTDNDLANYFATSFTKLGDHTAVILTLNKTKYMLISWNTTVSGNSGINNIAANVIELTLQHKNYNANTYWQVPVFIINTNCNATIVNDSSIAPVIANNTYYQTLFTTLCNMSSTQLGVTTGKYVLMEQVVGN